MAGNSLLAGIRVLDMSQALAGPYCGVLLSYLGAEVIKLEPPDGEPMRHFGSQWEVNWVVIQGNQSKRGITLNLNTKKGKEIFRQLLTKVDILLESFVPRSREGGWGFGNETLMAANPRLIHASVTGFGRNNAYSQVPAYDMSLQAMSGWMAATGDPDGPPMLAAPTAIDYASAFLLLAEIIAALWHREKTGKGQWVEVSMRDVAVNSNLVPNRLYIETGVSLQRLGNQSWGMTPGNAYRAKDGWVYMRAMRDDQAELIFKLIGKGDLGQDVRFNTRVNRWRNRNEVNKIVTEWTETRTRKEIFDLLVSHDIQCAMIMEPGEVLEDPELIKRGAIVEIEQTAVGRVKVTNPNLSMSEMSLVPPGPAPLLGEHNYEVYERLLGYSEDKIPRLKQDRVI